MSDYLILVLNPGSTSTKVAMFGDEKELWRENLSHSTQELNKFKRIIDQRDFRKEVISQALQRHGVDTDKVSAVVARGGLLRPLESGVWEINEDMVKELSVEKWGSHASNLGAVMAFEFAREWGVPAWIVDPVVVDEMDEIARISGMPEIQRKSIFHALNQKAVVYRYAKEVNRPYRELRLIVAHLGGGVSVGVHRSGRVVDVNDALNGDGPFTPERSGSVPVGELVKMCYSGKYSSEELINKVSRRGGFVAYLGTNDVREVKKRIKEGDGFAKLIYDAMIYQIGKEIGSAATVLEGKVDAIIITGGVAYDSELVNRLKEMIGFIADVVVYPGEDEMKALCDGALRALRGEIEVKVY